MRLITRSDFDGLVCAMLIKKIMPLEDIKFVHPKDLQDGKLEVNANDILTNVPYVPGCGLWFDHHATEIKRVVGSAEFSGACEVAPSAARVIYNYYGGRERFGDVDEIMAAVDKADSAQFTTEEILHPDGWPLLSFLMDARTGLGRWRDYRISNYQLMFDLIEVCATMPIADILKLPDVQERVTRYFEQDALFRQMLLDNTTTEGNVIITDVRKVDPIYTGNRFLIYALFPEQNTSIWMVNGFQNQNCVFACGHSILNRTSKTDIGALMRHYGGGGHDAAGTCQIPHELADQTRQELVATMNRDEQAER